MKKLLLFAAFMASYNVVGAVEDNTVEIVYNGLNSVVTVAENIKAYITVSSGTSSHVKIVQDASFVGIDPTEDNPDGEIIYVLSGSSTDGEFYMEGSFKATVELNGLTLANPSGPAINIQDGKRIEISAKKGTVNSLEDGANEEYNGCFHCKGHTKLKGKGTLNIVGNSKHGVYSKEYIEIKNITLNIKSALKDGIHCKEYFLMESGNVTIKGTQDDAIQVELGTDAVTDVTANHEEENTGNFYMTGGILTISDCEGKAIKADGTISYKGGTQKFDTTNTEERATVESLPVIGNDGVVIYDLFGRRMPVDTSLRYGVYLIKNNGRTIKAQCR